MTHVMLHRFKRGPICANLVVTILGLSAASSGQAHFADHVVDYDAGTNPVFGYTDPGVALGPPERFTGEGFEPMIVSVMNPAWRPDEIVSIGLGGHLTLRFDSPVTNDPLNPFGIDLLIFGNALLIDAGGGEDPDGFCTDPATIFAEGGVIEVSADGETWHLVENVTADGLFPTEGYLDRTDPYDADAGEVDADFARPVDPALSLSDFDGLHYTEVLDLYAGSGGGAGVDIGALGLSEISFVRISALENPQFLTPEIDAVADVRPRRPGDANHDGVVDVLDLLKLLAAWGMARPHGWDAEFTGDAVVDVNDLLVVLANWG
jgi:hypothetical protein